MTLARVLFVSYLSMIGLVLVITFLVGLSGR